MFCQPRRSDGSVAARPVVPVRHIPRLLNVGSKAKHTKVSAYKGVVAHAREWNRSSSPKAPAKHAITSFSLQYLLPECRTAPATRPSSCLHHRGMFILPPPRNHIQPNRPFLARSVAPYAKLAGKAATPQIHPIIQQPNQTSKRQQRQPPRHFEVRPT